MEKEITPTEEIKEENGFTVFNSTDGFFASPNDFETEEAAENWIVAFRNQYRKQGYYSTSDRIKISPDEIELNILPPNWNLL